MPELRHLDHDLAERLQQAERELLETEKALAQETLEHARTKETLAYTRGLLDRADKSETALHKYLDKQDERHQVSVSQLEEKVIEANRKIATIARELGSKEERIALLSGPNKLPGRIEDMPQETRAEETSLPLDVPMIWAALALALGAGIWSATEWKPLLKIWASAGIALSFFWMVFKFWGEVAKSKLLPQSAKFKRVRLWMKLSDVTFLVFVFVFLVVVLFR